MGLADQLRAVVAARGATTTLRSAVKTASATERPRLLREWDAAKYAESMACHTLFAEVDGWIRGAIHANLGSRPDQEREELFQDIRFRIAERGYQFRGQSDGEAIKWVKRLIESQCMSRGRKVSALKRNEPVEGAESFVAEDGRERSDLQRPSKDATILQERIATAAPEIWRVLNELIDLSEDHAVRLVEARVPEELWRQSRSKTPFEASLPNLPMGGSPRVVRRNIRVWKLSRILQLTQSNVVEHTGVLGEDLKPSSVSNLTKRGRRGVECGRRRALEGDLEPIPSASLHHPLAVWAPLED